MLGQDTKRPCSFIVLLATNKPEVYETSTDRMMIDILHTVQISGFESKPGELADLNFLIVAQACSAYRSSGRPSLMSGTSPLFFGAGASQR